MYCSHCAKEINEKKLEQKQSSVANLDKEIKEDTTISYVCPRCGHLIHDNLDEKEVSSLSRAAHAEMQRGHNAFAYGMGFFCVGAIILTIAIIFFVLAHKPTEGHALVTTCTEFYVAVVLFAISGLLLIYGGTYVGIGVCKVTHYRKLLRDLNNKTFVQ